MKALAFILLFLLLLMSGCQDVQKTPKPDNLITQDKMVDVLTEIAILHGARSYNKNLLEEKGIDPSRYIYEKYSIDSVQFARSNDYYSENVKQYQEIYSKVKERLEALRVEYDTIREREERRKDSLKELELKERDTLSRDSIRKIRRDSLLLKKIENVDRSLPVPVSRRDSID